VGEDRGAAFELAVEGVDLAVGGEGGVAGDVGEEAAFADQRAPTCSQRVVGGRRLDLFELADRQAARVEAAVAIEENVAAQRLASNNSQVMKENPTLPARARPHYSQTTLYRHFSTEAAVGRFGRQAVRS
jgi:hypothetical protein